MRKKLIHILLCLPLLTLAQQTYIPDDNFETALIALGLDTFPLNDSINTAAIDTVKSLYIISNSIIDLTGIEGFIALEELDCSLNNLYNIDVQSNLMLEELYIIGNPISALNLDYNINLTYLHIGSTGINYLDLSNNINLEWFNANSSSLDTLILGNKPSLNYITATNNNLNTLDASGCVTLSYLLINNNNLESLNFQNGNNTALTLYNSLNNPNLSCVQVDDANYSSTNWTNIDYSSSFSENCSLSGCTDSFACNYNSLAWIDDASCILPTVTIINVVACDYYITITDSITVSGIYKDTLINQFGCDSIISVNVIINNSSTSTSFVTVCDDFTWNNTLYSLSGTYSWSGTNILGCDSTEILNLSIGVCGCTDSLAFNYDINATINDSSCIAIIYGCMDSTQFNFNALANTDDGFCMAIVYGCTDTTAINYNSLANTNDGSCYSCSMGVNSFYDLPSNLQTCDGFIFLNPTGTAPYTFFWSNGATTSNINFNLCDDVYSYTVIDANGCGSSDTIVLTTRVGCTDPNSFNYDSTAIYDDGSCIASIYGCTDSTATNYDALVNTDDGSCLYCDINISQLTIGSNSPGNCDGWFFVIANSSTSISYLLNNNPSLSYNTVLCSGLYTISVQNANCSVDSTFLVGQAVYGCSDSTAFNFNLMANIDDGSCISVVNGCTDSTAFNYNSLANTNDGSCIPVVLGCADSTATNYDALVNTDDGSCLYCDIIISQLTIGSNSPGNCDGVCFVIANSSISISYLLNNNPFSSYSSGLCSGLNTITVQNANCSVDSIFLVGQAVYGCTDSTAFNFNLMAIIDDGSCLSVVNGCTDSTAFNYNSLANTNDGSCNPVVLGCADSTANNYDALVNTGDGSCLYCDINISQLTIASNSPGNCDGVCFVIANSSISISYLLNNNPFSSYSSGLCSGLYTISVQNDNCSVDSTFFVGQAVYGCTGPSYCNYDSLATVDDGSCSGMSGCMDPLFVEYSPFATCDDGSCLALLGPNLCTNPSPTGAYITELIHDRARVNWDNMNDANCMVTQYRIKYRELGTSNWSQKNMVNTGLCVFGLNNTSKQLLGLSPSTTYEYYMKAWYCGGDVSDWSAIQNFTTEDECENVINFAVSTPNTTKAEFTWDTTGAYSFARIKLRVDTTGSVWTSAGGFGVFYPEFSKDKNGLTPGQAYRASVRTWCDPSGGAYRADSWTSPIFWTQPTAVKLALESLIDDLAIYPNPATDIVNIDLQVEEAMLLIYDLTGRLVIQQTLLGGTNIIDVNALNAGIYQSHITSLSGAISINKIVISR